MLQGDFIAIAIDPQNNGNSAFYFVVNPVNAVADGIINSDGKWDSRWDAVFESATSIQEDHWIAEICIPVTSVGFQNQAEQEWGVMFYRYYASRQEKSINKLTDKNQPFRISDFEKITLSGLKKQGSYAATPYFYTTSEQNRINRSGIKDNKVGVDFRSNPIPSLTILGTVNPDYAQLETDREIINVTDLPIVYPEKRPFFTVSGDMYPGLAVNTRNIVDIKAGVKVKQVFPTLKYDVTGVLDGQENKWYLGNIRWTNNTTYHMEVIGGLKQSKFQNDYNITTHFRTWFFNRQLTAYTWFGTINHPMKKQNEYESVNSVKWISRQINAGLWNHFKTQYYNPNIVGHPALSNEIILDSWFGYSFIYQSGFFRLITPEIRAEMRDLYSHPGNASLLYSARLKSVVQVSNRLGNWELNTAFFYRENEKFRYRNQGNLQAHLPYEDSYGSFNLQNQKKYSFEVQFQSDYSKMYGLKLIYNNHPVRQANSRKFLAEHYLKIKSDAVLTYTIDFIEVKESLFQRYLRQTIHRLQADYNLFDKFNLRTTLQTNGYRKDAAGEFRYRSLNLNVALSWEYSPGSFLYLVFNRQNDTEMNHWLPNNQLINNQLVVFKINKYFSL